MNEITRRIIKEFYDFQTTMAEMIAEEFNKRLQKLDSELANGENIN